MGGADPYAGDKRDCDIVMKGGITSGVVYPGAAAELAAHYRFRSIGGTSAGAIAAALVAAAEHRRRRGSTAGFHAVAALPAVLAERGASGDLQLLRLFQPDPATAGLFDALLAFLRHPPRGGALRLPLAFPRGPALGLTLAGLGLGLGRGRRALGAGAGLAVGAGGVVADALTALRALPANDFGLCSLGPGSVGDGPALTAWLHAQLQTIAGRAVDGPVLTFADLWDVDPAVTDRDARLAELVARSRAPDTREVDLQMMATDLTHGRPWRLPAIYQRDRERLEQGGGLLFRPHELQRLFPAPVPRPPRDRGAPIGAQRAALLPGGGHAFRRFPAGPDLPVVVAARMSLAFPGLISAVPLWNVDFARTPPRLERVLFSDGGITSNFPVHFFDAPLPRRPTFGLHLASLPPGVAPPEGPARQGEAI